jgi:hypothetical protein
MEKPDLGDINSAKHLSILAASDTTDVSDYTRKGFWILTSGNVYVQAVGDSAIIGPLAVVAGQYFCWHIKHFGASSTATVVAGW